MKKLYSLPLVVILICGLLWGCEKKGNPPTLPPVESMSIDFSDFVATMKSGQINTDIKAVENTNWTVAATVAGWWNSLIAVELIVPVTAFEIAVNNSPTYLDKKTWQWKYSVDVVGSTYTARLTGQIGSNDIKWEMYISKQGVGSYAEFLWYEGTTALDGKSGTWTIKASHADQTPVLEIEWTKSGEAIGTIKYTYIYPGQFNGSFIEYGLTSNTLNAYYTVHSYVPAKLKMVDVNIEWSTSAHNGRVKAIDYFQDSNWYCWDGNGNDIVCPAK
jgi:hypothetical protein